jgi:hypothetical protein
MSHKIKLLLSSLAIAVAGLFAVSAPVAAQTPEQLACQGSGGSWSGTKCIHGTRTVVGTVKSVGNILIFITGAIAVLMIIVGGLRYTLSGGDQGSLTSAKNTILYAVVGLVVAIAAYAVVNFVLRSV